MTLLLTLFVSEYDYSLGGSPVTSDTLTNIAQMLTTASNDVNTVGVMIPASEIQRFGKLTEVINKDMVYCMYYAFTMASFIIYTI